MRYIATKASNMPNCLCSVPADGGEPDSYHLEQTDNMLKMSGSSMSVGRESRARGGLFGHPFEAHDLLTKMTGRRSGDDVTIRYPVRLLKI